MKESVGRFNDQLEKVAEMGLIILVGAMLPFVPLSPLIIGAIALSLLLLRPVSVAVAIVGEQLTWRQHIMLGWFGIRGVGSVYYLLYVLSQGVPGDVAALLAGVTLWTVAFSITLHGLSTRAMTTRHVGAP